MNYNNRDDMDMNDNLLHVDVSRGIGVLKRQNLPQYNESGNMDDIYTGVENGDLNGCHCY